jgi:hypothetical protein
MDPGGDRHRAVAPCCAVDPRTVSQAARGAAAAAPGSRGRSATGTSAGRLRVGLSPVRGVLQSRCDRAHALALLVTHRRLLEWNPSSDADRSRQAGPQRACRRLRAMWIAPLAIGVAMHLAAVDAGDGAGGGAGPAPVVRLTAHRLVDQPPARAPRGGPERRADPFPARAVASTWAFFDTFVGPEDHWLPPDNYQKYRVAAVAHRTSPTNIGMALLANLSAYDFGYLPAGPLVERTANTLRTLHGLERTAGTSTTGTTRRRCSRCRPCTSRRWTAATWPATC